MTLELSPGFKAFYDSNRDPLASEPAVRTALRLLGVAQVEIEYNGAEDEGELDPILFLDDSSPALRIDVSDQLHDQVQSLAYALLEGRHLGWERNAGSCGGFSWNLVDGTLEHRHCVRYSGHHTYLFQGFEIDEESRL